MRRANSRSHAARPGVFPVLKLSYSIGDSQLVSARSESGNGMKLNKFLYFGDFIACPLVIAGLLIAVLVSRDATAVGLWVMAFVTGCGAWTCRNVISVSVRTPAPGCGSASGSG